MKKIRAFEIGVLLFNVFSDESKSEEYQKHYSDNSFWGKLKRVAKSAGIKVVYPALLLQNMMKSDEVSLTTKLIISAGLGYFILPIDFIPDFAPLIGFADDLGVMLLILRKMGNNVTPEIKQNAREQLHKWFGETDDSQLDHLENQMI